MDKVKDMFGQLYERFSNPLVFSFLFSWVIINWKITIGLIWYDTTQIKQYGYDSIYQLIESSIDSNNSFLYPFFSALFYVLVMPIVKNLIKVFYTLVTKWGEVWSLKVAQNGQISIEKYFKLRQNYDERSKTLEDIISKENQINSEYEDLKTQNLKLQNSINGLSAEKIKANKLINSFNDITLLEGKWVNTYKFAGGNESNEEVLISGTNYYLYTKFGKQEHRFEIIDFSYDPNSKNVFFIKRITAEFKDKVTRFDYQHINRLKVIDNDLITGYEDDTTIIEYRRKK